MNFLERSFLFVIVPLISLAQSYSDLPFPVTLTPDVYWAAQPLPVQALRNATDANVNTLAVQLATQGYAIDVPIMVWHWDPVLTMVLRETAGYTWVPSALQPSITCAPNAVTSGCANNPPFSPYDPTKPPSGSIKVSTNASDYPPVAPKPPPTQATNLVGPKSLGNIYVAGSGAIVNGVIQVQDGASYVQDGVSYTAHVYSALMGQSVYFTQP